MLIDEISGIILDSAILVHRELGPGLLESAYQSCLMFELVDRGLKVEKEVSLPIIFKGRKIEVGYRLDLLVENEVIVEIKSIQMIDNIRKSQLLSYLKLSNKRLGLLINFNVELLKDGFVRMANKK